MVVAGTRPEAIKLAPVIKALDKLKIDYVFIWSGQHYDYEMSRVFFEQLGLPDPEEDLDIRSGSHAQQTAKAMLKLEKIIKEYSPAIILAEGDTNTVVATALTSVKMMVPFGHVEAGLRSWDRTMPEEINRIIADSVAELHFAPTELSAINLMHEGIPLRKIHITGNTIVDVVKQHLNNSIIEGKRLIDELGLQKHDFILLTIHRQENTEDPKRLVEIIRSIRTLSKSIPIVFPAHPRTLKKLKEYGLYKDLLNEKILILKPLGYFEFLGLLYYSKLVLTDSGGVQEEACTLKVPTLTLRYNTERPETVLVGVNRLVGTNSQAIVNSALRIISEYDNIIESLRSRPNPLGDGKAGEKIADILKSYLESGLSIESIDSRNNPFISYILVKKDIILGNNDYEYIAMYTQDGIATAKIIEAESIVVRRPIQMKFLDKSE